MSALRLPSFNDFSPGLFHDDLRPILKVIDSHPKDEETIFSEWERMLGWEKVRIRRNITATLGSTGLTSGRPLELSAFGKRVLKATSAQAAAGVFCAELIKNNNGMKLIEAIRNLKQRGSPATKKTLQAELELLGVSLANDTTDHTTFKNWMIVGGIVIEPQKGRPEIVDSELKALIGISSSEHDEFASLTPGQRVFLHLLRKRHVTDSGPFDIHHLYTECKSTHPYAFGSANLAAAVKNPLTAQGWMTVSNTDSAGRGGKSGKVTATAKLLDIPIERLILDFDTAVPYDLRSKLQTPLDQIKTWLNGADKHQGGLALELLSLKIILDLQLMPRGFRLRSKDSAFAEVDVTAEGDHLLFSRWTFQCKRVQPSTNIGLGDVAKEVGLAIYMKAHVIVMVSTGGFTAEALDYAREIADATHLQFLFLDKTVVKEYLTKGREALHAFVLKNARKVLEEKRSQPISPTA